MNKVCCRLTFKKRLFFSLGKHGGGGGGGGGGGKRGGREAILFPSCHFVVRLQICLQIISQEVLL